MDQWLEIGRFQGPDGEESEDCGGCSLFLCFFLFTSAALNMYICVSVCVCVFVCIFCKNVCACVCVCVHVCVFMYVYGCMRVFVVYVLVHTYFRALICKCV